MEQLIIVKQFREIFILTAASTGTLQRESLFELVLHIVFLLPVPPNGTK